MSHQNHSRVLIRRVLRHAARNSLPLSKYLGPATVCGLCSLLPPSYPHYAYIFHNQHTALSRPIGGPLRRGERLSNRLASDVHTAAQIRIRREPVRNARCEGPQHMDFYKTATSGRSPLAFRRVHVGKFRSIDWVYVSRFNREDATSICVEANFGCSLPWLVHPCYFMLTQRDTPQTAHRMNTQ